MKDIEKKKKLTFWNSAKSKLADFGLGGDDFSSFSEDISDGWFVTRCYNPNASLVFSSNFATTRIRLQRSGFTEILISDEMK